MKPQHPDDAEFPEVMSVRYKGITICVRHLAVATFDGVFTWNDRVICTQPGDRYGSSPQEAIALAKEDIDILLELRREGIHEI